MLWEAPPPPTPHPLGPVVPVPDGCGAEAWSPQPDLESGNCARSLGGLPGLPFAQRLAGGLEEPQAPTGDRRFLWASSFSSALPSGLEKVVENALFSLSLGD